MFPWKSLLQTLLVDFQNPPTDINHTNWTLISLERIGNASPLSQSLIFSEATTPIPCHGLWIMDPLNMTVSKKGTAFKSVCFQRLKIGIRLERFLYNYRIQSTKNTCYSIKDRWTKYKICT